MRSRASRHAVPLLLGLTLLAPLAIGVSPAVAALDAHAPGAVETWVARETLGGKDFVTFAARVGPAPSTSAGGGNQVSCGNLATGLDESCTTDESPLYATVECYATVLITSRGHYLANCHNDAGSLSMECTYVAPAATYLATGLPCVATQQGDIRAGATALADGTADQVPVGQWQANLITYD